MRDTHTIEVPLGRLRDLRARAAEDELAPTDETVLGRYLDERRLRMPLPPRRSLRHRAWRRLRGG